MNTDIHSKLAEFGREILYKSSLPEGLPLISKYAKEIIGAERCSMFIFNPDRYEFWTTLADGVDRITIPSDKGFIGETLKVKRPIIENDVHSNPSFLSEIDKQTGYTTKNIITAPIFNSKKDVVGVLELLNKDGGFVEDDAKYIKFFAHSLSEFIDLINLYEKKEGSL